MSRKRPQKSDVGSSAEVRHRHFGVATHPLAGVQYCHFAPWHCVRIDGYYHLVHTHLATIARDPFRANHRYHLSHPGLNRRRWQGRLLQPLLSAHNEAFKRPTIFMASASPACTRTRPRPMPVSAPQISSRPNPHPVKIIDQFIDRVYRQVPVFTDHIGSCIFPSSSQVG